MPSLHAWQTPTTSSALKWKAITGWDEFVDTGATKLLKSHIARMLSFATIPVGLRPVLAPQQAKGLASPDARRDYSNLR